MSTTTLRIGSLFTGTGALDMAAQAVVGGDVVWYSDIKPAAVRLLEHRYPGTPNLGDLTALFPVDVTSEHLAHLDDLDPARWLPVTADVDPIDLLTFGWPCQPHSSAGKRLGEADPRALLRNVLRAVGHLRPRILLGENVARVASNGELRRAVRALAALGYVGTWRCAPASDEGAPHKRDRVALVAVRADAVADAAGIALREVAEGAHGLDGERSAHGGRELLAAGAGRGGADARGGAAVEPADERRAAPGDGGDRRQPAPLTLLPTPTQNMTTGAGRQGREGGMNLQTAAVTLLPTPTVNDSRGGRNATARRTDPDSAHHAGWTLTDVAYDGTRWDVYAEAVYRWEHMLGRPAPDPTIPSPRTGGPQLSPWFVEWMMGLPAGWVCDVPDLAPKPSGWRNAALSLLGDGVVPQQLAAGFRAGLVELAARLEVAA